ncbi:MAG: hypothetical protein J1F07_04860 [Muribaculaceae bacterium]|nr:hypothetical protein [Muribaculaceae bacterium]
METFKFGEYSCDLVRAASGSAKITYLIYPAVLPLEADWLTRMADVSKGNVVVVYIPAQLWNDSLTPWPEPGETHDAPPFGGKAPEFLKQLSGTIVPQLEKDAGLEPVGVRNLIGVSLSGLFTLWQWMQCDLFASIGCMSGSFWFPGFMEWFDAEKVPAKTGKAFFLLGEEEPKAHIKAFRSVGMNTLAIVDRLKAAGVATEFRWVPGNHFSDPLGRAQMAFEALNN